jgi:para-nitrobenzyl esterase
MSDSQVPIIIGSNSAEAAALVTQIFGPTLNDTEYEKLVRTVFGITAGLILREYPADAYPSPWWALESLVSDFIVVCPVRRSIRWMNKAGLSSFLYSFAHTPSMTVIPFCKAACHAAELPYVFHIPSLLSTTIESDLSAAMVDYWSSFARDGFPSSAFDRNNSIWPMYTRLFDRSISFNDTISVVSGLRSKECNFWDVVQRILPPANLSMLMNGNGFFW